MSAQQKHRNYHHQIRPILGEQGFVSAGGNRKMKVVLSICAAALLSGCFQSTGDFGRRKPNAFQDKILPSVGEKVTWARGGDTSDLLKTDAETEYRKAAWEYLIPTRHNEVQPIPTITTALFLSNPSLLTAFYAYSGGRTTQGQDAITSLNSELQMANILPPREPKGSEDWYYYKGMEWLRLIPPQARTEFTQNYFLALRNTQMGTHQTRYHRLMADMENDLLHLPRFLRLASQVFGEDTIRADAVQKLSTIERDKPGTNIPDPRVDATPVEKDGVLAARVIEDRFTQNGYTKRVALRADENWSILERVEGRYIERIEAYRYALHHLVVETPSSLAVEAENMLMQLEAQRKLFPHRTKGGARKGVFKDKERFTNTRPVIK